MSAAVSPPVSCDSERLCIGVVQHKSFGVLRQAGSLLVDGLVEALLSELDAQAAGGHFGALFERFQIGLGRHLYLCQISFTPAFCPNWRLADPERREQRSQAGRAQPSSRC